MDTVEAMAVDTVEGATVAADTATRRPRRRYAPPVGLHAEDRSRLERWASSSIAARHLARRARILLLADDGVSNTEIAERVGVTRQTVINCRARYLDRGMAGLPDRPRSGRPRRRPE